MSASFTIATRNNGFSKAEAPEETLASVNAYRMTMAEFAEMRTMDIWYLCRDPSFVPSRSSACDSPVSQRRKLLSRG
jgi:Uncharacterized protein conserved in bacteria (DUF2252)